MSSPSAVRVPGGLLLLLMLAWMLVGTSSSPADPGPSELDRLESRVTGYFEALQSHQLEAAAAFILPASRDSAGSAPGGEARITGFSILEVEPEEGSKSAIVAVRLKVTAAAPMLAGGVDLKERLRWKLQQGEWFLDPADPPRSFAALLREYYYDKRAARANPKPGETPPPLEVEFEETVFDFGTAVQGEPLQPSFFFRNLSSRDILVKRILGPEWLITDTTEARLVPAGEAGEIQVELHTTRLHRKFTQDFFVQFEPIREMVKLRIQGWVHTPEEAAKARAARSKQAAATSTPAITP